MAKRPRTRKVDRSIIDQVEGGVTPLRALTVALLNRRDRKEDRKYQESLKDMGMFEDGGGRANVPKEYLMEKKSTGGKMKSADGIAIKGKTRLSMRGYGKNG